MVTRRAILLLPLEVIVAGNILNAQGSQTYALRFIEYQRRYTREGVRIREAENADSVPDIFLTGNARTVMERYNSLQSSRRIPSLGHLETEMGKIAEDMSKDENYLRNEFKVNIPEQDRQGRGILSADKNVELNGKGYRLLINAFGVLTNGIFEVSDDFMHYSMSSENDMELRQTGNIAEMWYMPVAANEMIIQQRAELHGNFNNLDLTGIRTKILQALKYQQIPLR